MKNHKSKSIIAIIGIGVFLMLSALFIAWGKKNTEEYNRKLEQYWVDYAKYCETKGEKLVKISHKRVTSKGGTIITYEGSCKK